ncbi:MAG: hypothetical protein GT598_12060 [Bacteroidales bacterium]|nr:hypothetical protein [Bacteroidales bacterium]
MPAVFADGHVPNVTIRIVGPI